MKWRYVRDALVDSFIRCGGSIAESIVRHRPLFSLRFQSFVLLSFFNSISLNVDIKYTNKFQSVRLFLLSKIQALFARKRGFI